MERQRFSDEDLAEREIADDDVENGTELDPDGQDERGPDSGEEDDDLS